MAGTDKSRSHILNEVVIAAARGPEILADNDRGSGATARARLHDLQQREQADRGVDTDKIAAFQRKVGMDVFDVKQRNRRRGN